MFKPASTSPVALRRAIGALIFSVITLSVIGLVMLYSVCKVDVANAVLSRQVVALVIGMLMAALIVMGDYSWLKRLAWPAYLVAFVLLGVVFFFPMVKGAHRWINLGGARFQPSEFAKLALILALAGYCANAGGALRKFTRGILLPAGIIGAICGPIFLEPDWGTTLITGMACVVMLLVAGARIHYVLAPALLLAAGLALALYHNPLRSDRIYSWLHLEETREDIGYQAYQARVALASGGLWGVGFDRSIQRPFIPEVENDFIFSVIGEEFGFAGSLTLVFLFGLILGAGVTIALHAPDRFGMLAATGITFLLVGQALCNLAVVSSLLPNKGLTLPFISKGGSSLMMAMVFVGVLMRIARASEEGSGCRQQPLNLFDELPLTKTA